MRQKSSRVTHMEGGVDRRFYELAGKSELKKGLRSGGVSVIGRRQFKDFDEYLI